MRRMKLFALYVGVVFTLISCQILSKTNDVQQTPEAAATSAEVNPYPVEYPAVEPNPNEYPSPQDQSIEMGIVYPELKDGDSFDWTRIYGPLESGQVEKVQQTHDLKVYLTLKDGRTLMTVEPAIDEILKLIQTCGEPCKEIRVATE
jgi:hypothetical protein